MRPPIVMLETMLVCCDKAFRDSFCIALSYRAIGHLPCATMQATTSRIPRPTGQIFFCAVFLRDANACPLNPVRCFLLVHKAQFLHCLYNYRTNALFVPLIKTYSNL